MSQRFRFIYLPIPKKDPVTNQIIGETYYPFVPIKISYGHQLGRFFHALIDSGAERNLFPAALGEIIGMNARKGKSVKIQGIGGVVIAGFTHEIKLYIDVANFNTAADFSYEQQVPLLGRAGFFNLFKSVKFKEKEKVVEIEK